MIIFWTESKLTFIETDTESYTILLGNHAYLIITINNFRRIQTVFENCFQMLRCNYVSISKKKVKYVYHNKTLGFTLCLRATLPEIWKEANDTFNLLYYTVWLQITNAVKVNDQL